MNKNNLTILLILIIGFASCTKEVTEYEYEIALRNKLGEALSVKLYPKKEYIDGNFYTNHHQGGLVHYKFDLKTNEHHVIYATDKIPESPTILLSEIVDSVIITMSTNTDLVIKFKPDNLVGYKQNMYDPTSSWLETVRKDREKTSTKKITIEVTENFFEIFEDKLVQNKN